MKRYRVVHFDFDTRATLLTLEIKEDWDEAVKEPHRRNKDIIRAGLLAEFGPADGERKIRDFIDLGPAPVSIVAFHNKFLRQVRYAFAIGSYYPALTAACALGERILNHLVLKLRDVYRGTSEYKRVYKSDSFDNWEVPMRTLGAWGVLRPETPRAFEQLRQLRNGAIHFRPDTDHNDRQLALAAIQTLCAILEHQFAALGPLPWFIPGAVGVTFIKKSAEKIPFIEQVYLPACVLVGPLHRLEFKDGRWFVIDDYKYEDREISDEEFVRMANAHSLTP